MVEIRCDLCDKVVEKRWQEKNPRFTGCELNGPPWWDKVETIVKYQKETIDRKSCVVCDNCKGFSANIKPLLRKETGQKRAKKRIKEIDKELKELEFREKTLEQEKNKLEMIDKI